MKTIPTTKRLTFLYFSIVACALIALHASVYIFTTEDIEHLYANNRLDNIHRHASRVYAEHDLSGLDHLVLQYFGEGEPYQAPTYYFNWDKLPKDLPSPIDIKLGESIEFPPENGAPSYFARRVELVASGITYPALLVLDISLYEQSEDQLLPVHTKQIAISAVLLIISLFVVMTIASRLTRPIATFANALSTRSPDDLSPITLPDASPTQELLKMVETFNSYQARIQTLLERERAFNRYASHELRTPLMVMQGAITLLGEAQDPAFVEKQRIRLQKATLEMREFVDTLLSISKATEDSLQMPRTLSKAMLVDIATTHQHLLGSKPVTWKVEILDTVEISIPEAAFHILVGNLIKNAFAYTEQGYVIIRVHRYGLDVIDTGLGLTAQSQTHQGFGLGLLLVRDICHQFHWHFSLRDNDEQQGCLARITFNTAE